jgi:hypothetical protein
MSGTGGSVSRKGGGSSLPVPSVAIRKQYSGAVTIPSSEPINLYADFTGGGLTCDLYHPPIVVVNDIDPSVMKNLTNNRLRLEALAYGPTHKGRTNGQITAQHGSYRHASNQDPSSSAIVTGPTRGGFRLQGSLLTPHRTAWDVTGYGQTIPVWETVGGFLYRGAIQSNGPGSVEVICNQRYKSKSGNGGSFGYQGKYTPLKLKFRYAMLADVSDPYSWVSGPESHDIWISATHHPFNSLGPDPAFPHRQLLALNPQFTPKSLNATFGTLVPS